MKLTAFVFYVIPGVSTPCGCSETNVVVPLPTYWTGS